MPDTQAAADRTASAMGERVARIETQIEGVLRDTSVIRAAQHDLNGEMQKRVIQEMRCVAALENIAGQLLLLPEIAGKIHTIEELRPRLVALVEESLQRRGGWRVVVMILTASMGAVTMIGTLAAGLIWLLGKVTGAH